MHLLAEGMSDAQVATLCDIHMRTVTNYRAKMPGDKNAPLQLSFDLFTEAPHSADASSDMPPPKTFGG